MADSATGSRARFERGAQENDRFRGDFAQRLNATTFAYVRCMTRVSIMNTHRWASLRPRKADLDANYGSRPYEPGDEPWE
jgi:hypothetical protein